MLTLTSQITNFINEIIARIGHNCFQTRIKCCIAYWLSCIACTVADVVVDAACIKARQSPILSKVNVNTKCPAAVVFRTRARYSYRLRFEFKTTLKP